jgi:hypothetical protein
MVKVVVVTAKNDPVALEFKDIYGAGSAMQTLSESVVGGCAFTVSFEKEEPVRTAIQMPKSRFIDPKEGEEK